MKDLNDRIREYIDHWPEPCHVALHLLRDALAEMDRHRWIPVGERVPGHEDLVQVWVGNEWTTGYYDLEERLWYWHNDLQAAGITHWRERPEPPEV